MQLVKVLATATRHLPLDGDLLPSSESIGGIPKSVKLAMRLSQGRCERRLLNLADGRLIEDIFGSLSVRRDLGTGKGLGQPVIVLADG
jgi:hypothetical protein